MKHDHTFLLPYTPWLLLLLGVNVFSFLLLWLADAQAFYAMSLLILLGTLFLFCSVCLILCRIERRKKQMFLAFLSNPDEYHEELLCKAVSPAQRPSVRLLGALLREKKDTCARLAGQLDSYEEYVESWAHEIKTPLSLLTLLLDNRGDELPAAIYFKLNYIRSHMQEYVDQMLFFARLKSPRKDHRFAPVCIRTCIEDLLEDYRPLLEEKQFEIYCRFCSEMVYTDEKSLKFLLAQIIGNSIKYSGQAPELSFHFSPKNDRLILSIRDNGIGVRSCDLPYIFEKGFTGDSGDGRKKATGMGLYLAREIAKELNISLDVQTEWGNGFQMQVSFPVVRNLP